MGRFAEANRASRVVLDLGYGNRSFHYETCPSRMVALDEQFVGKRIEREDRVWSPVRHDQAANDFSVWVCIVAKLQGIELPSHTPKRFRLIRNLGNLGNGSGIY